MNRGTPAFRDHRRSFEDLLYVYPVVSRRAGGLSIGINLNPDKICNFGCVYCQVDHATPPRVTEVDLEVLGSELERMLDAVSTGRVWDVPRLSATPDPLRRLCDFAFSGDGEPTTYKRFDEAVDLVVRARSERALSEAKVVLITDAGCLHHEHVRRGLDLMDTANGEIWGKLDAGTDSFYAQVNRTQIPLRRVLTNLETAALERKLVIQSLFFRQRGEPPAEPEIDAYIDRLVHIEAAGTIAEVHVYTIARPPSEPWCTALSDDELDALAARVRRRVTAPVRAFYGVS